MAQATTLTINTDTISRMADTLCAQTPGLTKNAVLGAFATAMQGPRGHWGSLKNSDSPVTQPGIPAPASEPRDIGKIFLNASSVDYNTDYFWERSEKAFRKRFSREFGVDHEALEHDNDIKYCETFVIDCDRGTVKVYTPSAEALSEELSTAYVLWRDGPFHNPKEIWEALRWGNPEDIVSNEGIDEIEVALLTECSFMLRFEHSQFGGPKTWHEIPIDVENLVQNDFVKIAKSKVEIPNGHGVGSLSLTVVAPGDPDF